MVQGEVRAHLFVVDVEALFPQILHDVRNVPRLEAIEFQRGGVGPEFGCVPLPVWAGAGHQVALESHGPLAGAGHAVLELVVGE